MKITTKKEFDIDIILLELGEFGRYQIKNFVLICIGIIVLSEMSLTYVFAAGILQYRWVDFFFKYFYSIRLTSVQFDYVIVKCEAKIFMELPVVVPNP